MDYVSKQPLIGCLNHLNYLNDKAIKEEEEHRKQLNKMKL